MNYKQILVIILSIIWTISVLIQQITWISMGNYNIEAFIIALVELFLPYVLFKLIKED